MKSDNDRSLWWSFPLLLAAFTISAWNMIIMDCDETFNYLEPLHYLIYGQGFQTWEYAPKFALRPYGFLLLFALPLRLIGFMMETSGVSLSKVLIFKLLRMKLGLLTAYSFNHLLTSLAMMYGNNLAKWIALVAAVSSGMFISSSAFLPNSISMILSTFAWSFWLRGHDSKVLLLTATSFVWGWPYSVFGLILPCLLSIKSAFVTKDGRVVSTSALRISTKLQLLVRRLIIGGAFSAAYILAPSLIVDRYYYGRWTFPSLNAILYNVFGSEGGPDLYGTEPWSYYLLNLTLNFSSFLPLGLLSPIALFALRKDRIPIFGMMFGLFSQFLLFSAQPHKEERFLFGAYPLLCTAAGFTLWRLENSRFLSKLGRLAVIALTFTGVILGILRSAAIIKFYRAPHTLLGEWRPSTPGKICMSSHWYRFPGSFYLPEGQKLGFLHGGFDGQLPLYFTSTRSPSPAVNNMNKAIEEQYSSASSCDYLMGTPEEFSTMQTQPLRCEKIFDLSRTRAPFKWIWIPILSEHHVQMTDFCIYRNAGETS